MNACATCGIAMNDKRKECRSCVLRRQRADPEFQARRLAGLRACEAMQKGSATRKLVGQKSLAARMANPEYVERLREIMRTKVQPNSHTPEAMAKIDKAARSAKVSAFWRSWCPPEMWADYQYLVRNKGMSSAQAKQVILAEHKHRIAALSPFERQMRALENGKKLIANDPLPSGNQVVRNFA